jgi:hypothetical protein
MMAKRGKPIDEEYIEWLYGFVASVRNRNPARSYWQLFRKLYRTRFEWYVHNDDNRAEDGIELRHHFIDQSDHDEVPHQWMTEECTMLEMLIALSRRAAFESTGALGDWFWRMLDNLGIRGATDEIWSGIVERTVEDALERVNRRTYEPDGVGGLFPLRNARTDQRQLELWAQLSSYILEERFVDLGP